MTMVLNFTIEIIYNYFTNNYDYQFIAFNSDWHNCDNALTPLNSMINLANILHSTSNSLNLTNKLSLIKETTRIEFLITINYSQFNLQNKFNFFVSFHLYKSVTFFTFSSSTEITKISMYFILYFKSKLKKNFCIKP